MMLAFLLLQFCLMSDPDNNNSCSMTGLLGIIIQVGLGVLSFSVLIIKRFRETPRRPWKIWLFDTSKQLLSQMMAHFINLTISLALAYSDSSSDQCLWYFITNILDNTLGVLICILCLKGIEKSLIHRKKYEYISGNYYVKERVKVQIEIMDLTKGEVKDSIDVKEVNLNGGILNHETKIGEFVEERDQSEIDKDSRVSTIDSRQPRAQTQYLEKYKIDYRSWLVQLLIWMSIVVIGKTIIFGIEIGLQQPLKTFSFFILGWIENYPVLELLLVMVMVPVIMNGLAFWIQDNFLKKKQGQMPEGESPLIEEATPRTATI